nr:type II toxin-antitoxin system VapC family toxin [Neorhizobium alkalisoli]
MSEKFLLDTCAIIWSANRKPLSDAASDALNGVLDGNGGLCVSVMSAWEVGMLVSRGRIPSTKGPLVWFEDFVAHSGVAVEAVTASILVGASYLPEPLHKDPVDRILIATAREHDLTIITRDRAILAYGTAGHVRTLAC